MRVREFPEHEGEPEGEFLCPDLAAKPLPDQ
jgi:hypothetical protein